MNKLHTVLATGGNRGIGLACCRRFAEEGHHVLLTARDPKAAEYAAEDLRIDGLRVSPMHLDVTEETSLLALLQTLDQLEIKVDVLINNAGVYLDADKSLIDSPMSVFQKTLDINLMGALRVARAFVPKMLQQGFGRVVNVSSGLGAMSAMTRGTGAYRISKLALNGMTRIMADEVDSRIVKINAVCPGWVATEMGGNGAPVSPEQAAESIYWTAMFDEDGPSGKFFRHKREITF